VSWRSVSGPDGFELRLLAGFAFLNDGSQRWLCVGDRVADAALGDPAGARKLIALLGLPWEEVEAGPETAADWQLKCMARMGPNMKARLRNSSVEEIVDWRAQMHTLEPGEALREKITGIDPLAGRN
jgi:hypothetical protein